jgi:hypothetical protein
MATKRITNATVVSKVIVAAMCFKVIFTTL